MIKNDTSKQSAQQQATNQKRPNETGSISVEGHVRIFDPKTKETFVEKRA